MAGSAFQGVRRVWLRDGRHAAALLSVLSVVRKGEGGRHRGGHNAWAGNAASSPESANSISPLCAMLRRPSIELACGCWPGGYRAGSLGAGVACRLSEAEFPMQDHVPPADGRYRQVSQGHHGGLCVSKRYPVQPVPLPPAPIPASQQQRGWPSVFASLPSSTLLWLKGVFRHRMLWLKGLFAIRRRLVMEAAHGPR